jgi:hypothetical protein
MLRPVMSLKPGIQPWRVRLARILAVTADLAQIVLFPIFSPGALSPYEDALDVAIGVTMIGLVGFHWSFVPAFALELVPFADMAPTWTGAVFLATRHRLADSAIKSGGPAPATSRPFP